jgi:hypothetical protein
MSDKPSRELSIEETLSRTFDLYLRNFVLFFVPMLAVTLISGYFTWLVSGYIATIPPLSTQPSFDEAMEWFSRYVPTLLGALFALTFVSWIVSTIATGIIVRSASDTIEERSETLRKSFISIVGKLPYLLASGFIVSVLTAFGLVALIVPGIIIILMYSLTTQAVVIENAGILGSLSRSRRLVSNRWLKTFALLLIFGLIHIFVIFIAILIALPLGEFSWIASNVIASFAAPLFPVSMTLHYYSMLAREQQQNVPPPPPTF